MATRITFIHTVASLIAEFNTLGASILPGVEIFHILDEVILEHIHQNGIPGADDIDRLRSHVQSAQQIQASAVLVTCSTLSACVDQVRPTVGVPVIKIDEALVETAVASGSTIGMLATNPDTLRPSTQMLFAEAERVGKTITVIPVLVEQAFAAIRKGDVETHNRLVKQAILELSPNVEMVVLAQATMSKVFAVLPENERRVPVLSSPYLALERVKQAIATH